MRSTAQAVAALDSSRTWLALETACKCLRTDDEYNGKIVEYIGVSRVRLRSVNTTESPRKRRGLHDLGPVAAVSLYTTECQRLQILQAPFDGSTTPPSMSSNYNTSPTILAASLYVAKSRSHFSLSALIPSSSYSISLNNSSLYSSLTSRFCTASLLWFTSKCITALGTWSAIDSRTMLKYEEMRRRISSVSRASRSVRSGACGMGEFCRDRTFR